MAEAFSKSFPASASLTRNGVLKKAKRLREADGLTDAIELLVSWTGKFGEDYYIDLMLHKMRTKRERLVERFSQLIAEAQNDPKDKQALIALGNAYMQLGKHETAEQLFSMVYTSPLKNVYDLRGLAINLVKRATIFKLKDNTEESAKCYDQAESLLRNSLVTREQHPKGLRHLLACLVQDVLIPQKKFKEAEETILTVTRNVEKRFRNKVEPFYLLLRTFVCNTKKKEISYYHQLVLGARNEDYATETAALSINRKESVLPPQRMIENAKDLAKLARERLESILLAEMTASSTKGKTSPDTPKRPTVSAKNTGKINRHGMRVLK